MIRLNDELMRLRVPTGTTSLVSETSDRRILTDTFCLEKDFIQARERADLRHKGERKEGMRVREAGMERDK